MDVVMQLIGQHSFLRQICGYVVRGLAVVTFFAGLTGFVHIWKFTESLSGGQIPGAVLFLLIFVIAIYMVIHILWIRGAQFFALPEAEFSISHFSELFLKTAAEVYAAFSMPMAVACGVLIWFTGGGAQGIMMKVVPFAKRFGDYSFTGGLLHMVGGVLYAFFFFILLYLLAELLVMVLDITMNIRFTRTVAEQLEKKK